MPISALNLSELDGSNGFVINGINPGESLGFSVSNAGDINGDGIDDLVIGAPATNTYVVFGGSDIGFSGSFDLASLDGNNGFVINGLNPESFSEYPLLGYSVSGAGDVNADGFDDLIVAAPSFFFGNYDSTYVIFGGSNVGASGNLDLTSLDGSNGFVVSGSNTYSVSSAGDINGDGIDDLIIGEGNAYAAGQSYVVFGGTDLGPQPSTAITALGSTITIPPLVSLVVSLV
jgi:hypothetical protein